MSDPFLELAEHIRDTTGCDVFLLYKQEDGSFVYAFRADNKDELLGAVEDALDRVDSHPEMPAKRLN